MEKLDLLKALDRELAAGRCAELVLVIGTGGSAPRGVGAWMAVFENGETAGTVGGGKIELFAIREGSELLQARQSRVVYYTIGGANSDTGMICGGAVRLCYLYVTPEHAELFQRVAHALQNREEGAFTVDFSPFAQAAGPGVAVAGTVHGEDSAVTIDGTPGLALMPEDEAGKTDYQRRYVEVLCPEGKTYIFGAGHVGAATARVLARAGFHVVVCDNRAGLLTPERLEGVAEYFPIDFENIGEKVRIGHRDLVVISTQGHLFDTAVTIQAMAAKPVYLGCIGSKRKTAFVHQKLSEAGFSDDDIATLHLPIGLPIDAEDPEEIAISIAAEMIKTRREKLIPRVRNK